MKEIKNGNSISGSGSGTVINYGSGSDFLTSYGSGSTTLSAGIGSCTVPTTTSMPYPFFSSDCFFTLLSTSTVPVRYVCTGKDTVVIGFVYVNEVQTVFYSDSGSESGSVQIVMHLDPWGPETYRSGSGSTSPIKRILKAKGKTSQIPLGNGMWSLISFTNQNVIFF